ncbi:MAG: OmpH family outer membrane protein [Rhizomicrobium sp.]|jgi:Skp family chaperone for outer membrane proteins
MTNSKLNRHRIAAVAAIALAASLSSVFAQGQPHPAAPMGPTRILVIDRQAVFQVSKVGQDVMRQINAYRQTMTTQLKSEQDTLQREAGALQTQSAILAPDVKAQRVKAFQAKEAAFRAKWESRQSQLQGGVQLAQQQIGQALVPILQGIMAERQANLLLDRAAVLNANQDLDITRVVIQRLDQKLPSVKVQMVSVPGQQLPAGR